MGDLRVSMPEDYAKQNLSRALATFIEAYPEIHLDLDLSSRLVDLIGERFDLAIRMGVLENDSTLVARKIDEQHLGLYASPIYLGLHPAPKHPDDLLHHDAVRMHSSLGQPIPWKLCAARKSGKRLPPGRSDAEFHRRHSAIAAGRGGYWCLARPLYARRRARETAGSRIAGMVFPFRFGLGGDADASLFARQDARISGAYREVHGERLATIGRAVNTGLRY